MIHQGTLQVLSRGWRTRARTIRRYGGDTQAIALEACAADLEAALCERDDTTLTLTEAASQSGYSADHLGRLVREGKIPNAGRPGVPRISLRDLPRKAHGPATESDQVEQPTLPKVSNAQIVQSIIEKGAR